MSDTPTRLAPRSAAATADTALLRAARAEVLPPAPVVEATLAGRIRSLLLRLTRPDAEAA